jgi:hypothetical protein
MSIARRRGSGRASGWAGAAAAGMLLAGCAGGADWGKPGTDEAQAAQEYQDCRATAATAVRTDADIDQDILATRGGDWQRGGIAGLGARNMQEGTRDRARAITASCMRAKGFTRLR